MDTVTPAATNWDEWVALGTLALAGATVLLGIVAVFQEPLRRHFARAKLSMEIRLAPPDSVQIQGTDPRTGQFVTQLLYLRIRVTHRRGKAAENTEILPSALWRKEGPKWAPVETFLPLSLAWSHIQPRTPTIRVPTGLFRHCDLGRFQPGGDEGVVFIFETFIQPNPVAGGLPPNLLLPGEYRFELMLSSDNAEPITKKWDFSFTGPWSDHEQTMLRQVRLEEV
jgi:hypothetical protein